MQLRKLSRNAERAWLAAALALAVAVMIFSLAALGLIRLPPGPALIDVIPVGETSALLIRVEGEEYTLSRWDLGQGESWTVALDPRGGHPALTIVARADLIAVRYEEAGPWGPLAEGRSLVHGERQWTSTVRSWGRWVTESGHAALYSRLGNDRAVVEVFGPEPTTTVVALDPSDGTALWPALTLSDFVLFGQLEGSRLLGRAPGGMLVHIDLHTGHHRLLPIGYSFCVDGSQIYILNEAGDLLAMGWDGQTEVIRRGLGDELDSGAEAPSLRRCGWRQGRMVLGMQDGRDVLLAGFDPATGELSWTRRTPQMSLDAPTCGLRDWPDESILSGDLPRFLFLRTASRAGSTRQLLRVDLDDPLAQIGRYDLGSEGHGCIWRRGERYFLSVEGGGKGTLALLNGASGRGLAAVAVTEASLSEPGRTTAAGSVWIAGHHGIALLDGTSLGVVATDGQPPAIVAAPEAIPFPDNGDFAQPVR